MRPSEALAINKRLDDMLRAQNKTNERLDDLHTGHRAIEQAIVALNERGQILTRLGVSVRLSLDELNGHLRARLAAPLLDSS